MFRWLLSLVKMLQNNTSLTRSHNFLLQMSSKSSEIPFSFASTFFGLLSFSRNCWYFSNSMICYDSSHIEHHQQMNIHRHSTNNHNNEQIIGNAQYPTQDKLEWKYVLRRTVYGVCAA